MGFGYHGAYLRIDATRGTFERVPLDAAVLRRYLGGSGLGARLLLDEGGAIADPLSPESPLVFAFSPLVGDAARSRGRPLSSARFGVNHSRCNFRAADVRPEEQGGWVHD